MNNKNGFEYKIIRITEKKELIPEAAERFSKNGIFRKAPISKV